MSIEAESTWWPVAKLVDVQRAPLRVRVREQWVGLYWFEQKIFALEDECPHASAPLTDGTLHRDGIIECALHGWRYSLNTGQSPLEYQGCVRTFSVRIQGENVEIDLRSL